VVSCNVLPPTVTPLGALVAASLRRDGGSRGTRRAVLAAVAGRFEKRFNRTDAGSDDDSNHARDFAAATVGYIEGILDDDDGGAIADLAHALVDVDASHAGARDFLGKELFPRFLSRELAGFVAAADAPGFGSRRFRCSTRCSDWPWTGVPRVVPMVVPRVPTQLCAC
jgi:hypothetical protein